MAETATSIAALLADPAIARLIAEPGPWWLWRADGIRLIATNAAGARAMGATGASIAAERIYSATHPFAGQIARLSPTLPDDGSSRLDRIRLFGRLGSEMALTEARRLTVGGDTVVAVTMAGPQRGDARAAAIAAVAESNAPIALYDKTGELLAAGTGAAALGNAPLNALLGGDTATVLSALAETGVATLDLVTGPLSLVALPSAEAILATIASHPVKAPDQGLRIVSAPAPDVGTPDATPVETVSAPVEMPSTAPEPAPMPVLASATPAPVNPIPALPAASPELPRRISWRMDSAGRFSETMPAVSAALTGMSWSEAAERFQLDPDGRVAKALADRTTFSGLASLWPMDGMDQRLTVALSGFPKLGRDGGFEGHSGFALVTGLAERAVTAALAEPAPAPTAEAEATAADMTINADEAVTTDADEAINIYTPAAFDAPEVDLSEPSAAEAPEAEATNAPSAVPAESTPLPTSGETRPALTVITNPPNVVALRGTVPDTKRAALSPVERNAFREIARALGARTEDELPAKTQNTAPAETDTPAITADAGTPHGPLPSAFAPPPPAALVSGDETKTPASEAADSSAIETPAPEAIPSADISAAEQDQTLEADPLVSTDDVDTENAVEATEAAGIDASQANDALDSIDDEPLPDPVDMAEVDALDETPAVPATEIAAQTPSTEHLAAPLTSPEPTKPDALADLAPARLVASLDVNDDARAVLDRLPMGIIVHRGNAVLYANRMLLDWAGFDSAGALELEGGVSRLFANGLTEAQNTGPLTITRADGTTVPVEARLAKTSWAGESALLFSLTRIEDASALPEATRTSLIEMRTRLDEVEEILDTATDGVVLVNADGTIESMNRSAEALFGYEAVEVKSRPFTSLFAPESRRSAQDYCDSLMSNGVASILNDGRQMIGRVKQGGLIPLYLTMGRTGTRDRTKLAAVFR
ncbi:MAG: PAS domain S-box protein, partial [Alphaproteobacteria bacterium]